MGPADLSRWVPYDCQSHSPAYEITPENVALDMDRVTAAYERLDTLLENCRYLVGDRFQPG